MSSHLDLMNTAQTAERLRTNKMGVHRYVRQGRLEPAFVSPRAHAFHRADVERLATELHAEAVAKAPEPSEASAS